MLESIRERYNKGYIRIDQLHKYVALSVISEENYFDICEEEYSQ